MFTGITAGIFPVVHVNRHPGLIHCGIDVGQKLVEDIAVGASVAVDGVCLTVVDVQGSVLFFDIIQETLNRTTLDSIAIGRLVNVERSLRFGSEVGGHPVSGHIFGVATIDKVDLFPNNHVVTLTCPKEWIPYILPKGYIAIDGSSLTVVDTFEEGRFTVHLIPETIRKSIIGSKKAGAPVNIELDSTTQAIVDAVRRYLS